MILPSKEFYFEGHTRLQLGFPTPNHLGAFITVVLPLLWIVTYSLTSRRWVLWSIRGVEGIGIVLLSATYSRGAALAYLAASIVFAFIQAPRVERRAIKVFQFVAPRVALLAVCAMPFGFWKRASLSYVVTDASTLNRLPVWQGAAVLFSVRPALGWGWGNSGQSYVNWVQEQGPTNYVGVLNTFFQINVELGGGVGTILIACVMVPLLGALRIRRIKPQSILPFAALAASICAWTVANSFSTLGESELLNGAAFVVFIAAVVLLSFGSSIPENFRVVCLSVIIALAINCAFYCWGRFINSRAFVPVAAAPEGVIELGKGDAPLRADVRVDPTVLGPYPGKQLRHMLVAQKIACLLRVVPPTTASDAQSTVAIYFGDTWALYPSYKAPSRSIFFYPRVFASNVNFPPSCEVWLPSKISTPEDEAWEDYCERLQLTVNHTASSAHRYADLSWPKLL